MVAFAYDDFVKSAMKQLEPGTNVLEEYDNFTYNLTLYMYDKKTQEQIDEKLFNGGKIDSSYDEKKIIIAQTGVTVNFIIESLQMKTLYGSINSPVNVSNYEINIKLREPMGANFTNALDVVSRHLGYPTHFLRPYWIDIYFTGYKDNTMERVKKIPLPDGSNMLSLCGMFGEVKSSVDNLGTTWDIKFIPSQHKFLNKDINTLFAESEYKIDKKMKLKDLLEAISEDMKKNYIKLFKEEFKKDVESELNSDKYIDLKYTGEKIDNVEIDPNISGDNTINNAVVLKVLPDDYFTTIVQKLLTKSEQGRAYVPSFTLESKTKWKKINGVDVPITRHKVKINFEKDEIIEAALKAEDPDKSSSSASTSPNNISNTNANNQNSSSNSSINTNNLSGGSESGSKYGDAAHKYLVRSLSNGSLYKKYIFGFSGIDTSVLEIQNKYDNLWFLSSIEDSIKEYTKKNYNNMRVTNKVTKVKTVPHNQPNVNSAISSALHKDKYVEDIFYDHYEDWFKDTLKNMIIDIPSQNAVFDEKDQKLASSSQHEDYDRKAIISDTVFNRLYKSGMLSQTKFTIIGDPYWITSFSYRGNNNTKSPEDKFDNAAMKLSIKLPIFGEIKIYANPGGSGGSSVTGSKCLKCVFELRTMYKQVKNYKDEQAGYIGERQTLGADYAMNPALNVSGIYNIYQCDSLFENGKFTQTLYGILDPHFLNEQ